jgi:phage tail sheath protein FI
VPPPGDSHFVGRSDRGTGLHAFDQITDVNILAIPGGGNDLTISAGMAYCRNRPLQDAFFVADVGVLNPADARLPGAVPDVNDKGDARDFVRGLSTPNDYGAVYYPWLRVADPIGKGRNPTIAVPPSGSLTGLYARIDNSRGVFKAPAGTETGLAGALGLCADIQDADQDSLNPIGLNVIRRFPGYGIVSWGTRTLATDPAWRYIPVRRMAIFLRASIYQGIQWAVFEPNDEPLWSQLRLNIRSFMLTQFRAGAFQGATPADAFFVSCDATTTTQQDIDNGVVNILVGFAPLKPAEFVVLRLSQKVNQSAA